MINPKQQSILKIISILGLFFAVMSIGTESAFMQESDLPNDVLPNDDPIPYVYYYSNVFNAFVIERADGSDSRLLAQGVTPEDHEVIETILWSPSGAYLAWASRRFNGAGAASVKGRLVSTDGTEVFSLLDDLLDIFVMEWAPNQDYLLVGFNGPAPQFDKYLWLIDVPNNRIVHEIQTSSVNHEPRYYGGLSGHSWALDGSALYCNSSAGNITRLGLDGTTKQWAFTGYDGLLVDSNATRIMKAEDVWDTEGETVYWTMSDLITQESRLYASFPGENAPQMRYEMAWNAWNVDQTFALVSEYSFDNDGDQRLMRIALFDWENGARYPIPATIRQMTGGVPGIEIDQMWSPDGQALMLMDDEIDRNLFVFDTATQTIIPIEGEYANWQWANGHDVWLFAGNNEGEGHVYLFDWQAQTFTELENVSPNIRQPYTHHVTFSPDGTYAGFWGTDVRVQNLITGETYTYPYHSQAAYSGGPVTGYQWHESNQWFFAGSNTRRSCCDGRAITLHHLTEPVGREVTICMNVDTCTGFVPDRVLPFLGLG